jgi:hypothetical protein
MAHFGRRRAEWLARRPDAGFLLCYVDLALGSSFEAVLTPCCRGLGLNLLGVVGPRNSYCRMIGGALGL